MTELKTLKDLQMGSLARYTLRQEAIKWVKAFDDLENNPDLKKFVGNEEECWIRYFFNITEEDLK